MNLLLSVKNLCVSVAQKTIIPSLSLELREGTTHVIMGPNGSGKSTFAYALAGHPRYEVACGSIMLNGEDVTTLSCDKRAKLGLFLSFQQPPEIPGVRIATFLKEIYAAVHPDRYSPEQFADLMKGALDSLSMDPAIVHRFLNDGFSGGEKKRFELLQLLILKPQLIIFDEIDSGLDVDALKLVSRVVDLLRKENPRTCFIIITHYQRILDHLHADAVHIMRQGSLVISGGLELVSAIEQKGYDEFAAV
jgi:Fe-S cluster assembly ATP-binding protein